MTKAIAAVNLTKADIPKPTRYRLEINGDERPKVIAAADLTKIEVTAQKPVVAEIKTAGIQGPPGDGASFSTNLTLIYEGALIS